MKRRYLRCTRPDGFRTLESALSCERRALRHAPPPCLEPHHLIRKTQMPSPASGSSRRTFLSSAAAASAYLWVPKPVKGYTAPEMRAMAVGGAVKPGVSKWELDTPALCVDLDK